MQTLDTQALRSAPLHVDSVEAVRTAAREPDAVDVSTDEDVENRDVRVRLADGTVVHAQYDRHAGMLAMFVAESTTSKVGTWLGAIDAPGRED